MGEGVTAFSTTREGGVSEAAYATFNITHYCGDREQFVAENRKRLSTLLGIDDNALILPRQTHGCESVCIDESFFTLSAEKQVQILHAKDAIITNIPHLCIGVSTADCVPILLYDHKKRVIAAIHAGWRGTVARIVEQSIEVMCERYSTDAVDIAAVIGPSISLDAFEVGNEVYEAFSTAMFPMEQIAKLYGSKWHIDLWQTNRLQLLSSGVPEHSINISGICTYASCDRFFSARRLGIESGRIFSGLFMN